MGWSICECNSKSVPYQAEFPRAMKGRLVQADVMLWSVASVVLWWGTPGCANVTPQLALDGSPPTPVAKSEGKTPEPNQVRRGKPEVNELAPAQVLRGMPVKVSGTGFDQAKEIRVRLNEKEILLDKPRGDDAKSFTFRIPPDCALGQYTVRVVFIFPNEQPPLIEGVPIPSQNNQLRIISDTVEKLKVAGIYPLVGYPVDGKFDFRVFGEGFSTVPTDNQLICTDRGVIDVTWGTPPAQSEPVDKIYGRVVNTRQLEFVGVPQAEHKGPCKFQIRVGDSISDPVPFTFARVRKEIPRRVAIVVVVVLTVLVYVPVTWHLKRYHIGPCGYRPWHVFLIDQETDTLSLSKLQLYMWTGAAVFGYTYLTVARSMIQGVFEFAPIPENLPGILAVSASTTVLATGISNTRGSKGSGEEQPSLSDLITTGGVVAPERFQFLVWTVLGVLAFLFLVLSSDPSVIQDLPKVPDGFLYLMGISSAGYLGGKLTRNPGPVIDSIVAQQDTVVIDIQGRNLSQQATFKIDDREVTCDRLPLAPDVLASGAKKDATLEVIRRENDATQTSTALALRLRLTDEKKWLEEWRKAESALASDDDWLQAAHRFCLVNPDAQKAVVSFTIKPKPKTSPPSTSTPDAAKAPTPDATKVSNK